MNIIFQLNFQGTHKKEEGSHTQKGLKTACNTQKRKKEGYLPFTIQTIFKITQAGIGLELIKSMKHS